LRDLTCKSFKDLNRNEGSGDMETVAALRMPRRRSLIGLALEDEDMVRSVEAVLDAAVRFEVKRFSDTEIQSGAWPSENFESIVASSLAFRNHRLVAHEPYSRENSIIIVLRSNEIIENRENIVYSDSFLLYDYNLLKLPSIISLSHHKLAIMPNLGKKIRPSPVNKKLLMLNGLPDREKLVLGELSRGTANQQIASRLNLTVSMVKDHIQRIFERLGFRNRTDAGVFAAAYLFDESKPNTTFEDK